ncbi:zf-HC2 domain-containing protein, partial [Streptomyces koyangensis]
MTAHRTGPPRHHLDAAAVARYASGELPEPGSWQVERHLEECGACADRAEEPGGGGVAAEEGVGDLV